MDYSWTVSESPVRSGLHELTREQRERKRITTHKAILLRSTQKNDKSSRGALLITDNTSG